MEKVNINTANQLELEEIIHIGPVRSLLLMDKRPLRDIYEISRVLGLGPKRMSDIIEQGIAEV